MSDHEDMHEQGLTHRQQMGKQHSPFITTLCAAAVVWSVTSGAAKEIGYKDARQMLGDAWGKAVAVVAAASVKRYEIPAQTLGPK